MTCLKGSFPIIISALQCYSCYDANNYACGDNFNSSATSVQRVSSTSGYCWRIMGETKGQRVGDLMQILHLPVTCPTMNMCKTSEQFSIKGTICCCQNKDFCNTASSISITFCVLFLGIFFTWIFT
ncbi:hypothetical protein I4U23_016312 [Adineta vaga]|nr:hypothetical protein I4U23_016312 [Adineta vaga]